MCADINYQAQSDHIRRLHRLFGNGGIAHLDLACGTGPHIRHFIDSGFQSRGLDINQPMLDLAQMRCPEAEFILGDMCDFYVEQPLDLISCFLYSIHYSDGIEKLNDCIFSVYNALTEKGVFCFNTVGKSEIDNSIFVRHTAEYGDSHFTFTSGWNYCGEGERQSLKLCIEKSTLDNTQVWHDEHPMVAIGFDELEQLLQPYFEVHIFEHNYDKIAPWDQVSGNAIFVCVKR
ncbi:class I SAM-dependent methyltransferase [Shewanella sp. D64]|uniref:class I SAM-dependent DNA methyltransferase n=1 Tax=unclassified Shewanella TaxID=196818 RepID=UPI0022BA11D0|nr:MULTISPECIES: class I SAM-dependent methyltransferase [unclassified Shewanella]MEC4726591.1 class I SAM-dependent methyltransferase [Shewanella sp. D64]MEC4737368.1 class I SAM-dependent methyltransferase [Shewanella sp. E94]WBJ98131.1 class I SAM-dependent methyltransferase [Shewanella sp. MTB7]